MSTTASDARTVVLDGVGDLMGYLSDVGPAPTLTATVGDTRGLTRLVHSVENLGDGLTVQVVADAEALDSVEWRVRGRAEGLRREGRLSVRTDDFGSLGDHGERIEAVAEAQSAAKWACYLGDGGAVVDGAAVNLDVHRSRWDAANPVEEIADCTFTELRRAVSEEIDAETAAAFAEVASINSDATASVLLGAAQTEARFSAAAAAVESCGLCTRRTLQRRTRSLVDDGRLDTYPVVTDNSRGRRDRRLSTAESDTGRESNHAV